MRAWFLVVALCGAASATTLEYDVTFDGEKRHVTIVIDKDVVRVDVPGLLDTATMTGTHVVATSALLGGKVEFDVTQRTEITKRLHEAAIERIAGNDEKDREARRTALRYQFLEHTLNDDQWKNASYSASKTAYQTRFGVCVYNKVFIVVRGSVTTDVVGPACLLPYSSTPLTHEQVTRAGELLAASLSFNPLGGPGLPVSVNEHGVQLVLTALRK